MTRSCKLKGAETKLDFRVFSWRALDRVPGFMTHVAVKPYSSFVVTSGRSESIQRRTRRREKVLAGVG